MSRQTCSMSARALAVASFSAARAESSSFRALTSSLSFPERASRSVWPASFSSTWARRAAASASCRAISPPVSSICWRLSATRWSRAWRSPSRLSRLRSRLSRVDR